MDINEQIMLNQFSSCFVCDARLVTVHFLLAENSLNVFEMSNVRWRGRPFQHKATSWIRHGLSVMEGGWRQFFVLTNQNTTKDQPGLCGHERGTPEAWEAAKNWLKIRVRKVEVHFWFWVWASSCCTDPPRHRCAGYRDAIPPKLPLHGHQQHPRLLFNFSKLLWPPASKQNAAHVKNQSP